MKQADPAVFGQGIRNKKPKSRKRIYQMGKTELAIYGSAFESEHLWRECLGMDL